MPDTGRRMRTHRERSHYNQLCRRRSGNIFINLFRDSCFESATHAHTYTSALAHLVRNTLVSSASFARRLFSLIAWEYYTYWCDNCFRCCFECLSHRPTFVSCPSCNRRRHRRPSSLRGRRDGTYCVYRIDMELWIAKYMLQYNIQISPR